MTRARTLLITAAAASLALAAGKASANLLFLGEDFISATGHGNVTTLLTLKSPGSTSNETGATAVNAAGSTVISDDAQPGNANSGTPSFLQLGLTDASLLRIALNAVEPGGDSITLNNLTLRLFNDTGSQAATTFSTTGPITFNQTLPGTGNSGFVFALDAAQASIANTAISQGFDRLTLSASLSNATGGPDTFFAYAVPEPSTYMMLIGGLGLVGLLVRRRMRA